jgi:hypothetical protein
MDRYTSKDVERFDQQFAEDEDRRNERLRKARTIKIFDARKAEITEMLQRLTAHCINQFGVDTDTISWGHVGDLNEIAARLRHLVAQFCPPK